MTRKDYQAIATSFGRALRLSGIEDAQYLTGQSIALISETLQELEDRNLRFNRSEFLDFMWEVARGERAMGTGERIAAQL